MTSFLQTVSRWNPLAALPRGWRRFRRRSVGTQVRTAGVIMVVVAGVAAWVALAPSSSTALGGPRAGEGRLPRPGSPGALVDQVSTTTRGIEGNTINVVFPVVALNSLAGQEGFASDAEFSEQRQAIDLYVADVNRHGGINGKTINPIVVSFDPTDQAEMRALCKDWTQGSPAAFAVVDGMGTWQGANQLCVAQEGHTPMIGQWTTVSSWTAQAAPYLWWTGVDQSRMLRALVDWASSSGLFAKGNIGVIAGDDPADQAALHQALLPDLHRAGVVHLKEATIVADPNETSETDTQAPLVIQRMRSAGVGTIIPLVPFNVMFPLLQAETEQHYFPRLALSDYGSGIQSALGLMPIPYEKALNGQEGVTALTLGGVDDTRPQSQGGYDPGVRSCYRAWVKVHPRPAKGQSNNFIEEQGPIASWCQAIRLFATAARRAGPHLNRRTFIEAMGTIKGFAGTLSPALSYGPGRYSGPTEYRVVRLHNNQPPSSQCDLLANGKPQGTCWVVVRNWAPLPHG